MDNKKLRDLSDAHRKISELYTELNQAIAIKNIKSRDLEEALNTIKTYEEHLKNNELTQTNVAAENCANIAAYKEQITNLCEQNENLKKELDKKDEEIYRLTEIVDKKNDEIDVLIKEKYEQF